MNLTRNYIDFGKCSRQELLDQLIKTMPTIKNGTVLSCNGYTSKYEQAKQDLQMFIRVFVREATKRILTTDELEFLFGEPDAKIKDSGSRTTFETGAVRDMQKGKGRKDLLPMRALLELSKHFEEGALKYDERNWEKGIELHTFASSAMNHLFKFMINKNDEPHLTAAGWNIVCLLDTILRIKEGELPESLNTLPIDLESINLHWPDES